MMYSGVSDLLENEILRDLFCYSDEQIRALRDADETFDAICRDYLSLSGEISRALSEGKPEAERFLADARDSLTGLTQEIEIRLERFFSTDEFNT